MYCIPRLYGCANGCVCGWRDSSNMSYHSTVLCDQVNLPYVQMGALSTLSPYLCLLMVIWRWILSWEMTSFRFVLLLLGNHGQSLFFRRLIGWMPQTLVGKVGVLALDFIEESVWQVPSIACNGGLQE